MRKRKNRQTSQKTGELSPVSLCLLFNLVSSNQKPIHKLKPKAWKTEVADLIAQNDHLYREMRSLKEEVAETETVKRCIEQAIPPTEQKKEKS